MCEQGRSDMARVDNSERVEWRQRGATKRRQEHQVSRCFYFETGANEHMSGVTDGWCSVLLFPASQKTVMFSVPRLRDWIRRRYV
jgi:hypothetical protein